MPIPKFKVKTEFVPFNGSEEKELPLEQKVELMRQQLSESFKQSELRYLEIQAEAISIRKLASVRPDIDPSRLDRLNDKVESYRRDLEQMKRASMILYGLKVELQEARNLKNQVESILATPQIVPNNKPAKPPVVKKLKERMAGLFFGALEPVREKPAIILTKRGYTKV